MRITIDIRSTLRKTQAGVGIYTTNLINALSKVDKEETFLLYSQLKLFSRKRKLPTLPGKNFFHRKDYFKLPLDLVLGKNIDVFHTSSYTVRPPKDAKFVLVVHDIIPKVWPYGHSEDVVKNFDKNLGVFQSADVIITPSISTKDDIVRSYQLDRGKIHVIYPGVDEYFKKIEVDENTRKGFLFRFNIKGDFLLFIGSIEPRKNLKNTLLAFKQLSNVIKQQLVVVGTKGWKHEEMLELINELNLASRVVVTGYVPREDLLMFYNLSDIVLYPSFYEGFGLPVVEAFRCKSAVITSNNSSLKEIAEGVSVLVDPSSPDSIKEAILQVLNNDAMRNELIERAYKKSLCFNWADTARGTMEVFKEG